MKRVLLNISFFAIFLLLLAFSTASNSLEDILRKLQRYHQDHPQQKLYVHHDKPSYTAGENIWFKAYLMEASLHTLDSQSRVVYAELINDQKTVFARQMLYATNGTAYGDFQLPDTLREGKYFLRAYTNFMRNASDDFLFTKEFLITNPAYKQQVQEQKPLPPDSLNVRFFPEGGNLVACGFNKVAFKATRPDGKSVSIEGRIVDEENTTVTTFKSQHDGMGVLRLSPQKNKRYYAYITKPHGLTRVYALPVVHEKGYVMQVSAATKNIKVVVLTNADHAQGDHTISLIVQSRGKAYFAQQGIIKNQGFFINIPKSKFPDGISQITLFDSQGRPVAERLIHLDHQERITLEVETDTTIYDKRKLVTVYANARYANGTPATANLSISVYNDLLIQNPEKYPLSITNYLSLTSDLKGYIENPGYYFKDSLAETKHHLDLLMMVHGWRRFTWNDVLTADAGQPPAYNHEAGIPIRGKVLKIGGKRPPVGSILKVMTMDGKIAQLLPDSLGRFYTDSLLYYDSTTLVFQTENSKGKKQPYKFMLDPVTYPLVEYTPASYIEFEAEPQLKQQTEEKLVFSPKTVVFSDVEIVAKRERDPQLVGIPGLDRVIDIKKTGTQYSDVMDLIQYKDPYAMIMGNPPNLRLTIRGKDVSYCINGSPVDAGLATTIPVTSIKYVEVLRSVNYSVPCNVNIVVNPGGEDRIPIGINKARYPGLYQAREFYSPDYAVKDDRHSQIDKRTTLFWEPMMLTDENGRAAIQFYTNDVASRYRVVVEGITADGYPGTSTFNFEVRDNDD